MTRHTGVETETRPRHEKPCLEMRHVSRDSITGCPASACSRPSVFVTLVWRSTVICQWLHTSAISLVCALRQLRLLRRSLTTDAAHSLVRALIHSRLDYCNCLFAGLPAGQMARLQSFPARFILQLPSRAPVSAYMRDTLHWLSYPQRIIFKVVSAHLQVSPRSCTSIPVAVLSATVCPLRSVSTAFCRSSSVCSHNRHGVRGFYYAAPASWNALPLLLRDPNLTTY